MLYLLYKGNKPPVKGTVKTSTAMKPVIINIIVDYAIKGRMTHTGWPKKSKPLSRINRQYGYISNQF